MPRGAGICRHWRRPSGSVTTARPRTMLEDISFPPMDGRPDRSSYLAAATSEPARPDEPADRDHDKGGNGIVEIVEKEIQPGIAAPFVAEQHADRGEREAPRPGAEKGVDVKAQERHGGDAGGKRDEGAHD